MNDEDLLELERQLVPFVRAQYSDPAAEIADVHRMPGHAGFSYGFTAISHGESERFFLRLPPPNVRHVGTADVLRQVAALGALDGTAVPHCKVRWSGDDPQWFGRPYFVVPRLEGDVVRAEADGWIADLSAQQRREMAHQAMTALADIHRLVWRHSAPSLRPPLDLAEDVARWDRFVPKAAEPQRLEAVPRVRAQLLARLPERPRVGIFHGDFQWANLFFAKDGRLLAVIDWELVGIGATLNDLGWIATFNDPLAWAGDHRPSGLMPDAGELVAMYQEAWGGEIPDLDWFRALAAYKFAIISGFNLGLHRRGKRHDPVWEITARSIEPLLDRAWQLLAE